MRTLKNIDDARIKFRKFDCDEKLKKVRSQKTNPAVERTYNMGESVYFRDNKKKEWKQGTALVHLGKTLYLKFGNWLRRVPIDMIIPDPDSLQKNEEQFVEADDEIDEDRFMEEELTVAELSKDLDTAQENLVLKEKVNILEEKVKKHEEKVNHLEELDVEKIDHIEEVEPKDNSSGKLSVQSKKIERRKQQKMKKMAQMKKYPTLGQDIIFKEVGSDVWKKPVFLESLRNPLYIVMLNRLS
jgi:hypothetical protein